MIQDIFYKVIVALIVSGLIPIILYAFRGFRKRLGANGPVRIFYFSVIACIILNIALTTIVFILVLFFSPERVNARTSEWLSNKSERMNETIQLSQTHRFILIIEAKSSLKLQGGGRNEFIGAGFGLEVSVDMDKCGYGDVYVTISGNLERQVWATCTISVSGKSKVDISAEIVKVDSRERGTIGNTQIRYTVIDLGPD